MSLTWSEILKTGFLASWPKIMIVEKFDIAQMCLLCDLKVHPQPCYQRYAHQLIGEIRKNIKSPRKHNVVGYSLEESQGGAAKNTTTNVFTEN